jgi:activating signal cointegrator complex subunit 2
MAHHQTSSSNLIAQLRDLYPYEDTKQSIDILPYVPVHDPLIQQDKRLHREEILKYQNRDAHLLLCCTNNKLWTLVFHDPSVNIFLETYLMNAERPFDIDLVMRDTGENGEEEDVNIVDKLEKMLYRRVFMIYWRMIHDLIDKQSIVKNSIEHAKVIHDCALLTIPKLLDLIVLYGYCNTNITRKLFAKLFTLCPEYYIDFVKYLTLMHKPLQLLINSVEELTLDSGKGNKKKSAVETFRQMKDIVNYLYDTSFTLRSLVELLPFMAFSFIQLQDKEADILRFLVIVYDRLVPSINSLLDSNILDLSKYTTKENMDLINNQSEIIRFQLDQVKVNIVAFYYSVINECFVDSLMEMNNEEDEVVAFYKKYFKAHSIINSTENMIQIKILFQMVKSENRQFEKFVSCISSLIPDSPSQTLPLILDYDKLYNLQQTIENIADQVERQDILDACTCLNSKILALRKKFNMQEQTRIITEEKLDESELEELNTLKDIFPDYGDGFLFSCLEYYNGSSEKTTDAILNNKLPKHLQRLDRKLANKIYRAKINPISLIKEEPSHTEHFDTSDIVSPNVWEDTDLFDDSEKVKIYFGKKPRKESIGTIDEGLRQRIIENYIYDDEYDDSYDDVVQLGDDEVETDNSMLNKVQSATSSESKDDTKGEQITEIQKTTTLKESVIGFTTSSQTASQLSSVRSTISESSSSATATSKSRQHSHKQMNKQKQYEKQKRKQQSDKKRAAFK